MPYVYWCYLPSSFFSSLQLLDLSHENADIVKSSRISNLLSFQVCFFAELNDGGLDPFWLHNNVFSARNGSPPCKHACHPLPNSPVFATSTEMSLNGNPRLRPWRLGSANQKLDKKQNFTTMIGGWHVPWALERSRIGLPC